MTPAFELKEQYRFDDLVQIMKMLRAPGGCPWDAEQTHQSIRKNMIEETYEVVEAIDQDNPAMLREELGDVLLQIVYHAAMEEEKGVFNLDDVCDEVCKKLIRRHPHIFGDVKADTAEEVLDNWETIKNEEKGQTTATETLLAVPKVLPGLMRCEKIQKRASRAGMDFADLVGAIDALQSEIDELKNAIQTKTRGEQTEELGDVLFSAVNVSRFLGADAEEVMGSACEKFVARFAAVEKMAKERGVDMKSAGIQKLDELWDEAKVVKQI